MTWRKEFTRNFAYPRFALEKDIWLKFRGHCVENSISVENAIRRLVIKYLKHNKMVDDNIEEDLEEEYAKFKKEFARATNYK